MELQVTGKNIHLTFEIRSYLENKLGRLSRHLPSITESKVEVDEQMTRSPKQRFVVQMTIDAKGTLLRSEERAEDIYAAIDKVAKSMDRQIERYKGRRYDKGRGKSLARGVTGAEAGGVSADRQVVKVKRYRVEPISVEQAIDQMELLGHDFYLFLSAESEQLNVLYRRKDGDYGLIEPEIA
jgi:putative sigma-54 modulation protein